MLLFALLLFGGALTANATTYKVTMTYELKAGYAYHFRVDDLTDTQIISNSFSIEAADTNGLYDLAYWSGDTGGAYFRCVTNVRQDFSSPEITGYLKGSSEATKGLLLCMRVKKNSLKLTIVTKTTDSSERLSKGYSKKHATFKKTKLTKGNSLGFKLGAGNSDYIPVIFGAKAGTIVHRTLSESKYERYRFYKKYMIMSSYEDGERTAKRKIKYETAYGNWRYICFRYLAKTSRVSGRFTCVKGKVFFFTPTDGLGLSVYQ